MGLPPNARRYFAEKRLDSAYKHLAEGQEDRREFQKFYNSLALFSGGTIALSVTYLGYLKSLSKPLRHQGLLTASWVVLFLCLLFSFFYVIVNLYYSFHFREREYAIAHKKKFEAELKEFPELDIVNLQTPQEIAEFRTPGRRRYKFTLLVPTGTKVRVTDIWPFGGGRVELPSWHSRPESACSCGSRFSTPRCDSACSFAASGRVCRASRGSQVEAAN